MILAYVVMCFLPADNVCSEPLKIPHQFKSDEACYEWVNKVMDHQDHDAMVGFTFKCEADT